MDQKVSGLDPIPVVDRATDLLYIVDTSGGTPNNVTPNALLGITSPPVGTTNTQTLTNKTLTSPTISSPVFSGTVTGTYTLGGTPTFPAAVVTLTGSQTLTNKTLTSPTINTATISNPTITADSIAGFTTPNSGTIYGVGITAGTISGSSISSNSVPNSALQTGIQSSKLSNPYKFSAYRNAAANASTNPLVFDTKLFDTGSNYSTSTGLFTAPVNGFYFFTVVAAIQATGLTGFSILLNKGGSAISGITTIIQGTPSVYSLSLSKLIQLTANDTVSVSTTGTTFPLVVNAANTYFDGYLVSTT